LRIGVAATAPLGADVLRRLAAKHEIAWLLTRPDRPRGRGRKPGPPAAKVVAKELAIPVRQPERLDATFAVDVDPIVVAAYGALIPDELLEQALWLNVHPSLLPRWRGAAPVERALMAGDEETGLSIIKLVKELDAGPIAAQTRFRVGATADAGSVYARAASAAAALLEDVLANPTFTPQPDAGVTYAHKITPQDRELDLDAPPHEVVNRVRALSPHIGARAVVDSRPLIVWRARVGSGGQLELLEVQPPGGRRMTYDEYLRGLR
jgi:methionyl-tRNA formyltransferase